MRLRRFTHKNRETNERTRLSRGHLRTLIERIFSYTTGNVPAQRIGRLLLVFIILGSPQSKASENQDRIVVDVVGQYCDIARIKLFTMGEISLIQEGKIGVVIREPTTVLNFHGPRSRRWTCPPIFNVPDLDVYLGNSSTKDGKILENFQFVTTDHTIFCPDVSSDFKSGDIVTVVTAPTSKTAEEIIPGALVGSADKTGKNLSFIERGCPKPTIRGTVARGDRAYEAGNYTGAMQWYRRASVLGSADAENSIGFMYDNGQGVPQDFTEAMRWYQKAADRGFATAQYNIGRMYELGEGVAPDIAQARGWMERAAESDDDAKKWLADHPISRPPSEEKISSGASADRKNTNIIDSSEQRFIGWLSWLLLPLLIGVVVGVWAWIKSKLTERNSQVEVVTFGSSVSLLSGKDEVKQSVGTSPSLLGPSDGAPVGGFTRGTATRGAEAVIAAMKQNQATASISSLAIISGLAILVLSFVIFAPNSVQLTVGGNTTYISEDEWLAQMEKMIAPGPDGVAYYSLVPMYQRQKQIIVIRKTERYITFVVGFLLTVGGSLLFGYRVYPGDPRNKIFLRDTRIN